MTATLVAVAACVASAVTLPLDPAPHLHPSRDMLVTTWEIEQGLPDNSVTSMVQTADGFLWFGTFRGLVRFDGIRFDVFGPREIPALADVGIVSLHLDRSGRLWVSTLEGLAVRENNRWRRLTAEDDGWDAGPVFAFAERPDGALLVSTYDHELLEWSAGRFRTLPKPEGAIRNATIAADAQGRWWIARNDGVHSWADDRWHAVDQRPSPGTGVGCGAARDGGVWVVSGSLIRKFRDAVEVERRVVANLPSGVWQLFEDSDANLWISTHDSGVGRIDPRGQHARWRADQGLAADGVRFAFEDRERNIWIGTSGGGLARLVRRRVDAFGVDAGITERTVSSVWPMRDGRTLIGTYGGGAFVLNDGRAEPLALPDGHRLPLYVQSVLEDRSGRLWIGLFADGVVMIDGTTLRRIGRDELPGGNAIALHEDARGRVWISGGESVVVMENDRIREVVAADGTRIGHVRAFAEGADGRLLIATPRAVHRLEDGRFVEIVDIHGASLRTVTCIRAEPDGTLWLGTDSGLLRWRAGEVVRVGDRDGLGEVSIFAIIEDAHGVWWLPTSRGLARINSSALRQAANGEARRLSIRWLGAADGMPTNACSGRRQPVAGLDANGHLWVATPRGVASVDTARIEIPTAPAVAHIDEIIFAVATRGAPVDSESSSRLVAPFDSGVDIPAAAAWVEFRYTAASFTRPEAVRFQTMLEGVDRTWRDVGSSRVATYHRLPPGRHVFRVRASSRDGIWEETGAAVEVFRRPHYWQTRWFQLGALIALVGATGLVSWRIAAARHRARRHELEIFQSVVEGAPNAMLLVDGRGRVDLVNSEAERELGLDRTALAGVDLTLLFPIGTPEPIGHLRKRAADATESRSDTAVETVVRRHDGSEFPAVVTVTPLDVRDRHAVLISITNIADRRRRESELAEQRLELAHMSRASTLGELSGSIAHELNQPLAAILSNAQAARRLIDRSPSDLAEIAAILDDIADEDRRAGEIIRRLRAMFTKGRSEHQPIDLGGVIEEVLRLTAAEMRANRIVVESTIDALPPVVGDAVQLQQVLLNLLVNARDAMQTGALEQRRILVSATVDDGQVSIAVSDSGPGVAADAITRIFDPFVTTKESGMGLGLAVCRTIVESHGGTIRVECGRPGTSGSASFIVTLPTQQQAE